VLKQIIHNKIKWLDIDFVDIENYGNNIREVQNIHSLIGEY